MKQITLVDFRGGYCTDVAPELMAPNELLIAQNCYWDSGLRKRKGTYSWDAIWGTATSIVGAVRAYMAKGYTGSGYYNIFALDNGASVTFYHSQSSVTATLFSAFNFTTGYNVEFADSDGSIIAVNGENKPAIMYCTATWEIMNLETYDTRERGTATWWAGRYDALGSASSYIDDTDDAQSSSTSDFEICRTTAGDGFYISCDYKFNKILLYNMSTCSLGAGGTTIAYYKGSNTWGNVTRISSVTTMGDPPSATQLIEFTWPSDWILCDNDPRFTDNDDLKNKYLLQYTFGASITTYVSWMEIYHNQYLTEVMDNDRPQAVAVHNRRVHLAAGNNVYVSRYGEPGGYELKYTEYFLEGGNEIKQMIPYQDYLVVLKENAIYGFYGNSLDTWVRKRLAFGIGTISKRSAAAVKNDLFFASRQGIIKWDGVNWYNVSKHIHSDYESWVATTAAGISYQGEYWVSFPSSTITLRCDPDTFKTDEMGEGRIGWYKTPLGFSQFIYNHDGGDNGNFFGIAKTAKTATGANHFCQLEYDDSGQDVWCGSTTAIDMIMQTGYRAADRWGLQTRYTRISPRISRVSASSGVTCTHGLISNNGLAQSTITQTLNYTNLIDRGNCENSSTGPAIFGEGPVSLQGSHAFTSTACYDGIGVYRFTKTVAAGQYACFWFQDGYVAGDLHGYKPGSTYELQSRVKLSASSSGGYQSLISTIYYNGGGQSQTFGAASIATTDWQKLVATTTLAASATGARFGIYVSTSLPLNYYLDIDAVYLTSSSIGAMYDQEYYTIPYTLDGKNLSYYFRHNSIQTIHLAGLTFEAAGRYF